MSEANNDLNWRVLKHLLGTHGSFPPNSITAAFVSGIFGISYNEANSALWWAVDQDFMVPVHNEYESENTYHFADLEIKNGMTIELNDDIKDLIASDKVPGSASLLHSEFSVELSKGGSSSCVLDDGRIMVKGVGYFPAKFFREKTKVDEQLYLARNEHGQSVPAYWLGNQWVSPTGTPILVSFVVGKVVPCINPDPNLEVMSK